MSKDKSTLEAAEPKKTTASTSTTKVSFCNSYVGVVAILCIMTITLYMAFAFPYTLLHLKQTETTEIKSVIIIGLNGEITPTAESYFIGEEPPEDLHLFGPEQLTNTGKKRMYLLGKFLKLRYYHLLLDGDPRKIYVRSADADKCLESAQALLAGLNPPKDRWIWSAKGELDNWQPKAIHTTDSSYDDLLSPESNCFKLEQDKSKWKNSTRYQQLLNEFRHDLQFLRQNTGLEFEDDLEMLVKLEESLRVRKAFKDDGVPEWYTPLLTQRLAHIADVTTESRFSSPSVQRLYVGRLLHEITENVNAKIRFHRMSHSVDVQSSDDGDIKPPLQPLIPAPSRPEMKNVVKQLDKQLPNVVLYMTDKQRLSALLKSFQIYTSQPQFGSLLLIELHFDPINSVHFLRLFTVSSSSSDTFPEPLRVNPLACVDSVECAPQQFEQNTRHLMLDKASWQEACLNNVPTITPAPKPSSPSTISEVPINEPTSTRLPPPLEVPGQTQQQELQTESPEALVQPTTSDYNDKLEENLIVGPTDLSYPPPKYPAPPSGQSSSENGSASGGALQPLGEQANGSDQPQSSQLMPQTTSLSSVDERMPPKSMLGEQTSTITSGRVDDSPAKDQTGPVVDQKKGFPINEIESFMPIIDDETVEGVSPGSLEVVF